MRVKRAPLITSRDPKGLQIVNLFEAAFNKSGLDGAGAQQVIERGGELKDMVMEILAELSFVETYANEEVRYPKGYAVTPIREQVALLAKAFPQLSVDATLEYIETVLPTLQLPEGADGWFAIPRWQKIADSYNEAVEKVFAALASSRSFYNYPEDQLGPDNLRQYERSLRFWRQLGEQQRGDILIVAAQFGKRHAGRSVRWARVVFAPNEFGIGAFGSGCMLLTNPGRLVDYDDLSADCSGDEYSPGADGQFNEAPCFDFRGSDFGSGELYFDTRWFGHAFDGYGSVSAFLPTSLRS